MAQVIGEYGPKLRETAGKREAAIERFRLLTDRFVEEMRRYDAKRSELHRDVIVSFLSRGWYRAIIMVIALGEFALNAQAFEVFQKPLLLTWLMAAAVGVGIPVVAHFCGIWVRQWPKPAWKTGLKLTVTLGGVVGCLIGINAARGAYLAMEGSRLGPQEQILQQAFLAINLFVFLAATVLSHFAHEEDQELDTLHKRVSRLDRKLDALDAEIHRLNAEGSRLEASQRAELEEIKAIVQELVSMYRGENVLARKDGRKPKAFEAEPVLEEPRVDVGWPGGTDEGEVDTIRRKRLRAKTGLAEAGTDPNAPPPA
jgi:uncharacterized small protein (DUF1192 family)